MSVMKHQVVLPVAEVVDVSPARPNIALYSFISSVEVVDRLGSS